MDIKMNFYGVWTFNRGLFTFKPIICHIAGKAFLTGFQELLRPTAIKGSCAVKGCRASAGDRRVRRLASDGRRRTSLRRGYCGGLRLGVAACPVYGGLASQLSGKPIKPKAAQKMGCA